VSNQQIIGLGCLLGALVAAFPVFAAEAEAVPNRSTQASSPASPNKAGELGEMRDWLNRRNAERKQLGLPGADMLKSHIATYHPKKHAGRHAKIEEPAPVSEPVPERGIPVLHLGRGPDGRIHVRYIVKEDGPDQLQVQSPDGYSDSRSEQNAAKLNRLTPRGKQVWLSGSSLRDPSSFQSQK